MLVLSLFPGIGLLDRAFEEVGFCVVRGPDVLWGGDVRQFHPAAGKFDGVIGGPPCQSFSRLAHLVRAQGHEPKFGNMIPEFERVVSEAAPAWFLMENVPKAPTPNVEGFAVHDAMLNNRWLGEEQNRLRRFSFGTPDGHRLRIETVALEAAMYAPAVVSDSRVPRSARQWKPPTVTGSVGGRSGSPKATARPRTFVPSAVTGGGSIPPGSREFRARATGKHQWRYRIPEALELQGLPADFLDDAPFTVDGKLKALANGVPMPMGRAIARAVAAAVGFAAPEQASA